MAEYTEYILPMVAVATYCICAIIKPLFGNSKKYIPLAAAAIGIVLAFWFKGNMSFETFVSGLISGFGATGLDQAVSIPIGKHE